MRVIDGGLSIRAVVVGKCELFFSSEDSPPFEADAAVFEEDRFLVLSAPAEAPDLREHPIRVITALHDFEPHELGTILVRRNGRVLAVVCDLERNPAADEGSVRATLRAVVEEAIARRWRSLAFPQPLGAAHGGLPEERSIKLLKETLSASPWSGRVWMKVRL